MACLARLDMLRSRFGLEHIFLVKFEIFRREDNCFNL